jgi:diacylglycerol kinase (ATP)
MRARATPLCFAGNDLARVLRWGPGLAGGEDPMNLLRDVIDAEEIRLDRWTVVFHPEDKQQDDTKLQQLANSTGLYCGRMAFLGTDE